MALSTELTRTLGIKHPILLAPMDVISGGRLTAAVSLAGTVRETSHYARAREAKRMKAVAGSFVLFWPAAARVPSPLGY
jgi:NAD(P)H-dependent flavin oxidoreductase YrpB (nitropropane dioxygenase family)